MNGQFEARLDSLFFDGERTEIYALIKDYREALEKIAYPANWPDDITRWPDDVKNMAGFRLENWMQSTAANALTNGGK